MKLITKKLRKELEKRLADDYDFDDEAEDFDGGMGVVIDFYIGTRSYIINVIPMQACCGAYFCTSETPIPKDVLDALIKVVNASGYIFVLDFPSRDLIVTSGTRRDDVYGNISDPRRDLDEDAEQIGKVFEVYAPLAVEKLYVKETYEKEVDDFECQGQLYCDGVYLGQYTPNTLLFHDFNCVTERLCEAVMKSMDKAAKRTTTLFAIATNQQNKARAILSKHMKIVNECKNPNSGNRMTLFKKVF